MSELVEGLRKLKIGALIILLSLVFIIPLSKITEFIEFSFFIELIIGLTEIAIGLIGVIYFLNATEHLKKADAKYKIGEVGIIIGLVGFLISLLINSLIGNLLGFSRNNTFQHNVDSNE